MWKPFDPSYFSVIFALNTGNQEEHKIVQKMITQKPEWQLSILQGKFEGKIETSYQVDNRALNNPDFLETMKEHRQRVFLQLDSGEVYVRRLREDYYLDKFTPTMGKFVEVSKTEAELGDYTYCHMSQKYYVIRK